MSATLISRSELNQNGMSRPAFLQDENQSQVGDKPQRPQQ